MTTTMGLAVALCVTGGVALALSVGVVRQRREYATLAAEAATLHLRLGAVSDDLASLREHVNEMGPPLIDARRRWPFPIPAEIQALIGHWSPEAVSWWLLSHAPGIGMLSSGQRTTTRFYPTAPFEGWTGPPVVASGSGPVASARALSGR
jgi:hypothetical protein